MIDHAPPLPPAGMGRGWGCETPTSEPTPPLPTLSPQEREGFRMFAHGKWRAATVIAADTLIVADGPALIVRNDTQIALLPGWRAIATYRADDLYRSPVFLYRVPESLPDEDLPDA